jgi:perosamine synthetase
MNAYTMNPDIAFLRAVFPEDIEEDLASVLRSGFVGAGESVSSFERALESYLSAPYITATSSGTAALTLAYVSAGIGQGAVVLSTPMTCAATNIPLLQMRARIAWLDIDPLAGNVTAEAVHEGLLREPDAQAVVIMDWGGVPCEYDAIASECNQRSIPLILDAAQSFGTAYEDKLYPHDVDYVCYSFGPTKLLSCVEGGAIATGRSIKEHAIQRIRDLRWYGIRRESRDKWRFWDYHVEELGYRFVQNNLFAAIGLRGLSRIDDRLRHHRDLTREYDSLLKGVSGLRICKRPKGSRPNFWLYTVLVQQRESLLAKLHCHGVHAATPHRRNDLLLATWNTSPRSDNLIGVEEFDQQYACLPIGPWMHSRDVERVCQLIRSGW